MIDFTQCRLKALFSHQVGNKLRDEGIEYSDEEVVFADDETKNLFLKYIFHPFANADFNNFFHESDLLLNETYVYAKAIFASPGTLKKKSKSIAQHLYNESIHPKISKGELYVAYFTNCIVEDELVDAIGIFKSETKEPFLKPLAEQKGFRLSSENGVNVNGLDKGCFIFNSNADDGYLVCSVSGNRGEEAQYWVERFLKIKSRNDAHHATQNYLSLAKNFVTKRLEEEYELSSADKAEYLKRSVEYFKGNEQFNEREFASKVFVDDEVIKSFGRYKDDYATQNDLQLSDDFAIAQQVVKKQAKAFKSVLKLDKNFHIYIHGDTQLIEKGYDEQTGKHYYKIYFDKEA